MSNGKQLAHARAKKNKWADEVRRLEEAAASDQCLHMHEQWDGPYRISDRCTQPAGHSSSGYKGDHGPWKMLSDQERRELVALREEVRDRTRK